MKSKILMYKIKIQKYFALLYRDFIALVFIFSLPVVFVFKLRKKKYSSIIVIFIKK